MRLDESVGIIAVEQRHHSNRNALAKQLVAGAKGRLQSRFVAVIQEKNVLRKLSQRGRWRICERRSHRGDHGGCASRHQPDGVEIALDDEHLIFTPDVVLRPV
jgi:hypothetical protein